MPGFLQFLRCLFCCIEEYPDDNYNNVNSEFESLLPNRHSTVFPKPYSTTCSTVPFGNANYGSHLFGSIIRASNLLANPSSSIGPSRIVENSVTGSKKTTTESEFERAAIRWTEKHFKSSSSIGPSKVVVNSATGSKKPTIESESERATSRRMENHFRSSSSIRPSTIVGNSATGSNKATIESESERATSRGMENHFPSSLIGPSRFVENSATGSKKPTIGSESERATSRRMENHFRSSSSIRPSTIVGNSATGSNKPTIESESEKTLDEKIEKYLEGLKSSNLRVSSSVAPEKSVHPEISKLTDHIQSKPSSLSLPIATSSNRPNTFLSPSFCSPPFLPSPKSSTSPLQVSSPRNLPSSKSILSCTQNTVTDINGKAKYIYVENGTASIYKIPKIIEDSLKEGIVPEVLRQPLTRATYKEFFAALLNAEDFYAEKWKNYHLKNVKLELRRAEIYKKSSGRRLLGESREKDFKIFVGFKIDFKQERPFFLSRDFVFAKPLGKNIEPYQGVISRVVKSNLVLAEFGGDFYKIHRQSSKYDISFSFNRVCLKRAHQAVESVSDLTFENFLFPVCKTRDNLCSEPSCYFFNDSLASNQKSTVRQILRLRGSPPYLVNGLALKTESVVEEVICQIYHNLKECRILVCAPTNMICDELMSFLTNIPKSTIFRANAAFREKEDVPENILPSCRYKGECFVCPPLRELRKFKVISSTYMSSFRLHTEGITTGHFSHIFLMDASSALEPEVIVPLVNFADHKTTVVVTGDSNAHPYWIRSDIARRYGLKTSFFERLSMRLPYSCNDPVFIKGLRNDKQEADDAYRCVSF